MDVMKLLMVSLAVMLVDTFPLARLLNLGAFKDAAKRRRLALTVIVGMAAAGGICYFADLLQEQYLQMVVFVPAVALLAYLVALVLRKLRPALYQTVGSCLPFAAVNCAVLGGVLLHTKSGGTLIDYVTCGLVSALAFLLVGALFTGIRQHLELMAEPPGWLRGYPVALLTAALMALAFCGFAGLQVW